jgi:protein-disulfide isomerase
MDNDSHAHHKAERGVSNKMAFLDSMTPIQIFAFGLVQGILVLCTIGFFIMLASQGSISFGSGSGVQQPAQAVAPTPSAVNDNLAVRPVSESDHIRGNANADITIVEYSDFECPFCKQFHGTMEQVIAKYGDDVRWVYRHLPLDSLHRQARQEALASECAGAQGKFWEYADLIFDETTSNDGLNLALLPDYAARLGLRVDEFNTCMSNNAFDQKIRADEADAQNAGARGTPYSVIVGPGGEIVPISGAQPFSAVEQQLAQFLN